MQQTIIQVDAFTDIPFKGNPAAVCVLAEARDEDWMQRVANEMNLAETAFLVRQGDDFHLRWFTPETEVALCGHATLASAHVLWEKQYCHLDETLNFHTQSGLLTAKRQGSWIELDFPADQVQIVTDAPSALLPALGISSSLWVGRGKFDYLVEVESEEIVRAMAPKFSQLKEVQARGVIVTSKASGTDYDFVSRFFGPQVGINEDPVTGSAHCSLAPYWSHKFGRTELTGYQASKRGGTVKVTLSGDRVMLGGQAVTVLTCQLV